MTTTTEDACHEELMEVLTRIADSVQQIANAIAVSSEQKIDNLQDQAFIARKILEFVGKHNSIGVTYRELNQSCHAFKRSDKTLRDFVLKTLVSDGLITEKISHKPSGRAVIVFHSVSAPCLS
jgi:hypothetical protein